MAMHARWRAKNPTKIALLRLWNSIENFSPSAPPHALASTKPAPRQALRLNANNYQNDLPPILQNSHIKTHDVQ